MVLLIWQRERERESQLSQHSFILDLVQIMHYVILKYKTTLLYGSNYPREIQYPEQCLQIEHIKGEAKCTWFKNPFILFMFLKKE